MNVFSKQRGFTLVELSIVIAIIGLLAAIAVPIYKDYTVRAKVTEGLNVAAAAKLGTAEYYQTAGTWPQNNAAAGVPAATSIVGEYVQGVRISTGSIYITYTNDSNIAGRDIVLVPDARRGSITWGCTYSNASTIDRKYRPANCR